MRSFRIYVAMAGVLLLMAACTSPSGEPTASASVSIEPSEAAWHSSDGLTARPLGESDAPLGYYEYLPPGYPDGEGRPLLVALHGYGGNGDGSATELFNLFETGIPAMIQADDWPEDRPFVVLMPQHDFAVDDSIYAPCDGVPFGGSCVMAIQHENGNPAAASDCMTPAEVHDFLTFAIGAYEVDTSRVYLTGLSCGGFAAYEYAAAYGAEQIAAMVPIATDARPAWVTAGCELGNIPIWAFQGDADDVVDPADQIDPITALMDCVAPVPVDVELTVYPGVDHDSWTRTYDLSAENDIYDWMLGFSSPGS
jgi:predicted peptidase